MWVIKSIECEPSARWRFDRSIGKAHTAIMLDVFILNGLGPRKVSKAHVFHVDGNVCNIKVGERREWTSPLTGKATANDVAEIETVTGEEYDGLFIGMTSQVREALGIEDN